MWAHPSGQRCMKVWSPVMPQNEETSPARIGQFTKIGEFTCCFPVHNNFLAVSFPVSKARGYKPHKGYQASKRAERSASRNGASYLGFSWAKAPVAKHTSQAPKGNGHTPIFPLGGQTPDGRLSLLKLAPFGQLVSSYAGVVAAGPAATVPTGEEAARPVPWNATVESEGWGNVV